MKRFLNADEMREADRLTIQKKKITSFQLMNLVAEDMVKTLLARDLGKRFLVLTGPGNNGGDGFCVAERLRKLRFDVSVLEVYSPVSEDCKKAAENCRAERVNQIKKDVIIIDAIFGIGGRRRLDKSLSLLLEKVNNQKGFKISLDCPTPGFYADLTLCVGFYKEFFLDEDYSKFLGEIELISQFFVEPVRAKSAIKIYGLGREDFYFKSQKRNAHKGYFGRCGLIAGSAATPGAAFLAGEAAARVGAGYVTVFFADKKNLKISVKDASFILKQKWSEKDLEDLSSVVAGCGGYSQKIKDIKVPYVVDAEALQPLSKIHSKSVSRIFTPHPLEAARLLGWPLKHILKNKWEALSQLTRLTKSAVYLKGAPGILQFYDEPYCYYVNLSINPIFAKAGSGDLLAGILGGFLAQAGSAKIDFKSTIFSALVFQREVGEVLRNKRGSMVADQLNIFSEAFNRLKYLSN